jgi:hypothetical protein
MRFGRSKTGLEIGRDDCCGSQHLLLWQKISITGSRKRCAPNRRSLFTASYVALRGLKVRHRCAKERIAQRFEQVRLGLKHRRMTRRSRGSVCERFLRRAGRGLVAPRRSYFSRSAPTAAGRNCPRWRLMPTQLARRLWRCTKLADWPRDAAYRKGLRYLMAGRKKDGSGRGAWHVTRAQKPSRRTRVRDIRTMRTSSSRLALPVGQRQRSRSRCP